MTPPDPIPEPDDADLALYALGALDETERRSVETRLATDASASATEGRLRRAAGAVAAAADLDAAPPTDLRDRVLAAARTGRAPETTDLTPTDPTELHRIQGELLVDLLRTLRTSDWLAPVDPPELAGWTVRDVVAHLAAVQGYLAQQLGIEHPGAPERQLENEARTAAAIERHRRLDSAAAVAEVEALLDAVDADVAAGPDPAERAVTWWGVPGTADRVLVIRAVELWTHAADIARALGRPEPVPSAPALRTMSTLATALTPVMCEVAGTLAGDEPRWVRFELTGPGGATHDVGLAPGAEAPSGPPDATLTLDIVDYCRAVARRVDLDQLPHQAAGDLGLAAAVVDALPALAVL